MGEWQQIETAPRDGTVIQISDNRYSGYPAFAAYFDATEEIYPWRFLNPLDLDGIGEMEDGEDGPTHWQPLAIPPQED